MSTPSEQQERIRRTMAALWERNLPVVAERVSELERAAAAAAQHSLTHDQRLAASATAHKLAGSVGMFGYMQATEFARTMEQMLEGDGVVDALALCELAASLRSALKL